MSNTTSPSSQSVNQSTASFEPSTYVSRDVLPVAIKHGMELWWDGSTPTKRLDDRDNSSLFSRYVNARIEGKFAEVAFAQILETYFSIDAQVDWRIYGDYEQTDDGDLEYLLGDDGVEYSPAVGVDVKKTKPWNQWLAIRREIFDRYEPSDPLVLAKLSLNDDLDLDQWRETECWDDVDADQLFRDRLLAYAEDNFPVGVDFVGAAYPEEFTDAFQAGDQLYDPDTGATLGDPLKRDNMGIHVEDLISTRRRWNRIIGDVVGDNPISFTELDTGK